jgi:SOS response regulatory protein OraA/RecX
MKPTPRQSQEIHKNYERVVEHLITEGYADDRESADNIINGMSESWFNLIITD